LNKTHKDLFFNPCSNFSESFFLFNLYLSETDQKKLIKGKNAHQNHLLLLSIGRIFINVSAKEEKIWFSFWEYFIYFFYDFCTNSYEFYKRIIQEIKKKINFFLFQKKEQDAKKYKIRLIVLTSQYQANSGRFFFYKIFESSNWFRNLKNINVQSLKKNLRFITKKFLKKKKIEKVKKFFKIVSTLIQKNSRETQEIGIMALLKLFCFFNENQENLICYSFFLCFFFFISRNSIYGFNFSY
jgi:hypothetical protein